MNPFADIDADLLGWAAVSAGLALFACLLLLLERRGRADRERIAPQAVAAPRLERGMEWERVMHRATRDLGRAPKLAELQANATVKLEAAEHAYNLLVRDCSKLFDVPAAATFTPASKMPCETEYPAERPPLAA